MFVKYTAAEVASNIYRNLYLKVYVRQLCTQHNSFEQPGKPMRDVSIASDLNLSLEYRHLDLK